MNGARKDLLLDQALVEEAATNAYSGCRGLSLPDIVQINYHTIQRTCDVGIASAQY